jgi:predicted molibdopterin-dependent oxidoreductase YjgC
MWGSNARDAHPIFFHHVLKGINKGAKMIAVDPRRSSTAKWADAWLGLHVGSDISLANAIGNEIIQAGLVDEEFIRRATVNFEDYKATVARYTLERAERDSGVPADLIRQVAHAYAKADRAQICWTLGITEHHNAVDNVVALINLALLTGHVGKYGSGLAPLRGQNNVQGGGDMGAIPNKLAGFQDIELDHDARSRFSEKYGVPVPARKGLHLSQMFEAMERGELTTAYIIGENPVSSEANAHHTRKMLEGLDCLVVQDIVMTETAKVADVVLPGTASWCESEGTVTNSERRVQRVRKAIDPPGQARDDVWIIGELARRLGYDWGDPTAEELWNELRELSPMHRGISYEKIDRLGGVQWPCEDEESEGTLFLHERLWAEDPAQRGEPAPFHCVENAPPLDTLTDEYPIRLTTGRRLDSYNTGVATNQFTTPLRRKETLDLAPEDAAGLSLAEDDIARITSRRGTITAPVHVDTSLRPGLAFMTLHFPDQVEINILTLETWDPKSGVSEFKATAIRVEPASPEEITTFLERTTHPEEVIT